MDIVAAMVALVAVAAIAFMIPQGSTVRWALALPVLLIAPGYLLLQAIFTPAQPASTRLVHALVSLGISPALVGLLALSTALFGAFREGPIIVVVTGACLVIGVIGLVRRGFGAPSPEAGGSRSGADPEA